MMLVIKYSFAGRPRTLSSLDIIIIISLHLPVPELDPMQVVVRDP